MKNQMRFGTVLAVALFAFGPRRVSAQQPAATPVKQLIRDYSRNADDSTPESRKKAALDFERALSTADPRDPWWPKAQYDLGYDLAAAGEYQRAIDAFERVIATETEAFPGLRSSAADQAAQAAVASKIPTAGKIALLRRAVQMIEEKNPLAPYQRMTNEISVVQVLEADSAPTARNLALAELKVLIAAGKRGSYSPRPDTPAIKGYDSKTWNRSLGSILRNMADISAERRDRAAVSKVLEIYNASVADRQAAIAIVEALSKAEHGPSLSASEFKRILASYPTPTPARAGVLADAIGEATSRDDCALVRKYANELLAMKPVPEDDENPENFFPYARQALAGCGVDKKRKVVLLRPGASPPAAAIAAFGGMTALTCGALGTSFRKIRPRLPVS